MDRRTYLLLCGVSLVLVVALLGTPLWDHWYYAALRSSPGSNVPMAVLVGAPADSRPALSAEPVMMPATTDAAAIGPAHVEPPPPSAPPSQKGRTLPEVRPVGSSPSRDESRPVPVKGRSMAPAEAPEERYTAEPGRTVEEASRARIAQAREQLSAGFYQAAGSPSPPPADPGVPPEQRPRGDAVRSYRVQPPPSGSTNPDPDPSPAGPPVVSLAPESTELSPAEELVVVVQVTGAASISSLPFHLRFDPEVLEFVDSRVGAALDRSHEAILLASVNPNRPGDLAVGLSLVESSGLFSGSGDLVHLRFRAVAQGESDLEFVRASLRGATSQPLDARFEPTRIKVIKVR